MNTTFIIEKTNKIRDSFEFDTTGLLEFPICEDYYSWITKKFSIYGRKRWIGYIYDDIINEGLIDLQPEDVLPLNVYCNGVYIISDENGELIYIGSRDEKQSNNNSTVLVRLFDHLVPVKSDEFPNGQPSSINNTPGIWDEYLKKNKKIKVIILMNMNYGKAVELETFLLNLCFINFQRLPKFNKKI